MHNKLICITVMCLRVIFGDYISEFEWHSMRRSAGEWKYLVTMACYRFSLCFLRLGEGCGGVFILIIIRGDCVWGNVRVQLCNVKKEWYVWPFAEERLRKKWELCPSNSSEEWEVGDWDLVFIPVVCSPSFEHGECFPCFAL